VRAQLFRRHGAHHGGHRGDGERIEMTSGAGRRNGSQRPVFRRLLATFWLWCLVLAAMPLAARAAPPAVGYSDAAHYDADRDLIVVRGWLHEAGKPVDALLFSVMLGGQPARVLDVQRSERREVAQALGLPLES